MWIDWLYIVSYYRTHHLITLILIIHQIYESCPDRMNSHLVIDYYYVLARVYQLAHRILSFHVLSKTSIYYFVYKRYIKFKKYVRVSFQRFRIMRDRS